MERDVFDDISKYLNQGGKPQEVRMQKDVVCLRDLNDVHKG